MTRLAVTRAAFGAIPGFVHGFERRAPGHPTETRREARARVEEALAPSGRLHLLNQVHGAEVVAAPFDGFPEADAALAREAGILVGVETADCLPILLVDPGRRAVAAVHAGWRGTAARVVERAVEALVASGSHPPQIEAALGPCIGACCYEVGDELRPAFGAWAEGVFSIGPRGRPHLDLRGANVLQLLAAGVAAARIQQVPDCTFCAPELYHSFRRDGAAAGRMISFAGFAR